MPRAAIAVNVPRQEPKQPQQPRAECRQDAAAPSCGSQPCSLPQPRPVPKPAAARTTGRPPQPPPLGSPLFGLAASPCGAQGASSAPAAVTVIRKEKNKTEQKNPAVQRFSNASNLPLNTISEIRKENPTQQKKPTIRQRREPLKPASELR